MFNIDSLLSKLIFTSEESGFGPGSSFLDKRGNMASDQKLRQYLDFLERAEGLKNAVRTAYTSCGRQESAAEHSWRLALMALIMAEEFPDLDNHRVLKLCLVHDLGEAVHGDISALAQREMKEDKAEAERRDLHDLAGALGSPLCEEIVSLWEEYENAATPEARLVKGLDKLETLVQHNQGQNPGTIDYHFNLEYGRAYMQAHPLLEALRVLVDESTARRAAGAKGIA